jgi:hypothetical protein
MKIAHYIVLCAMIAQAFVFQGCTKEEGVLPLPTPAPVVSCKLIKSNLQNSKYYNQYEYANNKLIKTSNYKLPDTLLSYTVIVYNAQSKPVKTLHYNGRDNSLTSAVDIEYGVNGQWSKRTATTPGKTGSGVSVAEYDADGNRVKITFTSDYDEIFFNPHEYVYEYVDGNVSRQLVYYNGDGGGNDVPGTPSDIFTYAYYTDKENKTRGLEAGDVTELSFNSPSLSKNLIKSISEDDQGNGYQYLTEYTYELNTEGYVTKRIGKKTYPTSSGTETILREYTCN